MCTPHNTAARWCCNQFAATTPLLNTTHFSSTADARLFPSLPSARQELQVAPWSALPTSSTPRGLPFARRLPGGRTTACTLSPQRWAGLHAALSRLDGFGRSTCAGGEREMMLAPTDGLLGAGNSGGCPPVLCCSWKLGPALLGNHVGALCCKQDIPRS